MIESLTHSICSFIKNRYDGETVVDLLASYPVDIDREKLVRIRHFSQNISHEIIASSSSLPLQDSSADCVLCGGEIYRSIYCYQILTEARRVHGKNGAIVIYLYQPELTEIQELQTLLQQHYSYVSTYSIVFAKGIILSNKSDSLDGNSQTTPLNLEQKNPTSLLLLASNRKNKDLRDFYTYQSLDSDEDFEDKSEIISDLKAEVQNERFRRERAEFELFGLRGALDHSFEELEDEDVEKKNLEKKILREKRKREEAESRILDARDSIKEVENFAHELAQRNQGLESLLAREKGRAIQAESQLKRIGQQLEREREKKQQLEEKLLKLNSQESKEKTDSLLRSLETAQNEKKILVRKYQHTQSQAEQLAQALAKAQEESDRSKRKLNDFVKRFDDLVENSAKLTLDNTSFMKRLEEESQRFETQQKQFTLAKNDLTRTKMLLHDCLSGSENQKRMVKERSQQLRAEITAYLEMHGTLRNLLDRLLNLSLAYQMNLHNSENSHSDT